MDSNVGKLYEKQLLLASYYRDQVTKLKPNFRTPDLYKNLPEEATSMVVCYWPADRLKVRDIRQTLWDDFQIWVQPDFASEEPGLGLRVSIHYATTKLEIDGLLEALSSLVRS